MSPFPLLLVVSSLAAAATAPVDFSREVQPIISEKCYQCHGPDEGSRKAKLRLDVREDALKERDGCRPLVPGKPDESELMTRILSKDPDEVMPPPKEHHMLTAKEAETLRRWIAEGAPYAKHWSFSAPSLPPVPAAKTANPIDAFVQARLAKEGLNPSADADPHTLCRRLYLDLIGLPPKPAEVDAFIQSAARDRKVAINDLVDKLLASTAYGEKWARMWLDLARYADSTGYGSDKFRMNVWPYRDWVIDAFNRNMPYDEFTIEQLAGDLLPKPTREQLVATAFHRNTMTQTEGGTDDEEYRVAAVKDRVAVTGQVWMGLTFGCAQCHTHKFDPISHHEYYSMFAVFNQTEDADREDEEPKLPLPTKEEQAKMDALNADIAKLEASLNGTSEELESELHEWEATMHDTATWTPLVAALATSDGQATMTLLPDNSVQSGGTQPKTDRYTVKVRGPLKGVTAFRVEALLNDAGKGPGRFEHGNFVLSDLRVNSVPIETHGLNARYIRVEQQAGKLIHLAEIQAFAGDENVALKGTATLSSTGYGGVAPRLIDGNTNGDFDRNSVVHTADGDKAPFAEVDLGSEKELREVVLWNRTDGNTSERIKGAKLVLLDAQRKPVFEEVLGAIKKDAKFALNGEKNIGLRNASADYEQKDFAASAAIDASRESGWAVAGAIGESHALVVETAEPLDLPEDRELVFKLSQNFANHTLGRFRISTTTKAPPVRELPPAIAAAIALEPSERTPEQREKLLAYYRPLSRVYAETQKTIASRRTELAGIKPVKLPVMRERTVDKRRETHVLNKGNFLAPGDMVQPGVPAEFQAGLTVRPGQPVDRLAVAKWLVSAENPLTARVTVNRFWAQLFGTGIVETEEDFGTQGALPSHPELLDWLAVTFRTPKAAGGLGWDVKALLKLIVTSHAYCQSSVTTPEHLQKDARNRLLAHYPRRRLEAETIRDQALALSGLLSHKIGGPSVYPPQPGGLWSVAFNGGQNNYPESKGEDRYRRGLYTFWRRIAPNPTMATFDAPSRETCTVRRVPTNTPLQAFVMMNDPVFVEAAQALARRIVSEGGAAPEDRIRWALSLCLARPAKEEQVATLRKLYESELTVYRQDADAAKKLATVPLGALPEGMDVSEVAAWTSVANVLLNLDAVLTRS